MHLECGAPGSDDTVGCREDAVARHVALMDEDLQKVGISAWIR